MLLSILSGVAAFLSFSFAVYLVKGSRRSQDRFFAAALFVLAGLEVADRFSLTPGFSDWDLRKVSQVLEALAALLFVVFSHIHARNTNVASLPRIKLVMFAIMGAIPFIIMLTAGNDLFYSPDLMNEEILFLGSAGFWFYLVLMATYILSIMQIERTFTATLGSDRYRIKLEIIGIMSLFAVMILYYSHSLLYRTINMNLLPVRSGVLIAAVVLMGFSRIVRGSGIRVSLSRHVYYRSVALLIVGAYLLTLGLVGEGMKYVGYDGGKALIIFMAFAGGVIVLIAILSEKLRRAVKVLVSKHFFAAKYDYRDAWLKFTDRLASCSSVEEVRSAIRNTFREFFGLEYVILYVRAGSGHYFEEMVPGGGSKPEGAMRLSEGLSRYFLNTYRVWNPKDSEYRPTEDEKTFAEHMDALLVVPLINNDDIEGLVLFGKQLISEAFIYEDYDLMKSLGRQAAQALANTRLVEELMESREIAAVARVSSFVIHDLKNLTTGLSIMVDNARENMGNPEFQKDAIETVHSTVEKMKRLIQRLKAVPEKAALQCQAADIDSLVGQTVAEFARSHLRVQIAYRGVPALAYVDSEEIQKVVINMLQNAIEACGDQGTITLETRCEHDSVVLKIGDEGPGMSAEFINAQLFRPFRTTKPKGLGIGLYQCKQIIEAHGGKIDVESVVGKGTIFTVRLPLADVAPS